MAQRKGGFRIAIRLRHKIAAIGVVGGAGLFVVGAIYLGGTAKQEKIRAATADAHAIAVLTDRLAIDLLQSRHAERDFLLRNNEEYVERHAELSSAVTQDLLSVQVRARASKAAELDRTMESIREGFDVYLKHFAAMVDAKRKLGFNENSGFEGALRNSVHAIETKLKEFNESALLVSMLMMRRHEKDFMLRRDPKYGEEMKKRATEFTQTLAASAIPAAVKEDIGEKLAAYQRDFFAWVNAAIVLGDEQKKTSASYATIDPLIDTVRKTVNGIRAVADAENNTVLAETAHQMEIAILIVFFCVMALAFLIGRAISRPLSAMSRAMRRLAAGDFDVVLPGIGRRDEIGDMVGAVETFKIKAVEKARADAEREEARANIAAQERRAEMQKLADGFEAAVGDIVQAVSSASTELEAAAKTLIRTAETTEQMSAIVAGASEETSSNVQSVASATQQLTSSVAEISRQVHESSRIAGDAVGQAGRTDTRINALSEAASRIGDVVKLITAIAEQTNLLALNATIEAARAGEAGRGFAVVAQEVKALAAQTAKATGEIGGQIAEMQTATQDSVSAIKEIGATITRISEIAMIIASAVEQQGATTKEIAHNVQQAAQGTVQVATNIGDVNRGASETGTASVQVLSAAKALSSENGHLKLEVERFLASVRAA